MKRMMTMLIIVVIRIIQRAWMKMKMRQIVKRKKRNKLRRKKKKGKMERKYKIIITIEI
jgi:hypothetical protein